MHRKNKIPEVEEQPLKKNDVFNEKFKELENQLSKQAFLLACDLLLESYPTSSDEHYKVAKRMEELQ